MVSPGGIEVAISKARPRCDLRHSSGPPRLALNLEQVLTSSYGLDLTGWTLSVANGISNDGKSIVGYGSNPLGQTEAWIATVPEPSTLAIAAIVLVGFAAVGWCRRKR